MTTVSIVNYFGGLFTPTNDMHPDVPIGKFNSNLVSAHLWVKRPLLFSADFECLAPMGGYH